MTGGWDRSINNREIGQKQPRNGAFLILKAATDPTDEHGVGDRGYNDDRYSLIVLPMALSTDPAVNAAVSTAIIDANGGVIITLTGAGNAQTLQAPTTVTPGTSFTVVSNDGNGANTIEVNGITLSAGEAQRFIWDGTAWIPVTAVDADDITFTPAGTIVATNVQAAIEELDGQHPTTITEFIPISAFINGSVAPDAAETLTSTNSVDIRQFSGTVNQDVKYVWEAPDDLLGGTITVSVICWISNATAPANGEIVAFSISGDSIGNSDLLSESAGGAQTSSLTADATYVQYDRLKTAFSSAITIVNLAAGESVNLDVIRLATTTDTYAQKIGVAGINVKYSRV
uniref:Uncharacterized protein n=2 Tax=viral metagenome TaxID=1070528 RepID=A0A6M3JYE7_9ZZZZ